MKQRQLKGNSRYKIFVNKLDKNKIGETMCLDLRTIETHKGVEHPLSNGKVSQVTLTDGSTHILMISPEKLGQEVQTLGPRIENKSGRRDN